MCEKVGISHTYHSVRTLNPPPEYCTLFPLCHQTSSDASRHGLHQTSEGGCGTCDQDVSSRSFKSCQLWVGPPEIRLVCPTQSTDADCTKIWGVRRPWTLMLLKNLFYPAERGSGPGLMLMRSGVSMATQWSVASCAAWSDSAPSEPALTSSSSAVCAPVVDQTGPLSLGGDLGAYDPITSSLVLLPWSSFDGSNPTVHQDSPYHYNLIPNLAHFSCLTHQLQEPTAVWYLAHLHRCQCNEIIQLTRSSLQPSVGLMLRLIGVYSHAASLLNQFDRLMFAKENIFI